MNLEQTLEYSQMVAQQPLVNQPDRTYGDILNENQLTFWGQYMFDPEGAEAYYKSIGQEQRYKDALKSIKNDIQFYDREPVAREKTLTRFEQFIGKDLGFGDLATADRIYGDYPANVARAPFDRPGSELEDRLRRKGFQPYNEYVFDNNINPLKDISFLRAFGPMRDTPRSVKQYFKAIGIETTPKWTDRRFPEDGVQVNPSGGQAPEDYVFFDSPVTTARDFVEAGAVYGPALAGELILGNKGLKLFESRFRGNIPSAVGKVGQVSALAASSGFGAAGGEAARLTVGSLIGANDLTLSEIAVESGITGAWATGGTFLVDVGLRFLKTLYKTMSGGEIPAGALKDLEDLANQYRDSATGVSRQKDFIIGEEITSKDIQEAVSALMPDVRYAIGKNATLGTTTLDELAFDLELTFLKNSDDPQLRKLFLQIQQGEKDLMNRFITELNLQVGNQVDSSLSGTFLQREIEDIGGDRKNILEAASNKAINKIEDILSGRNVSEGGTALQKDVVAEDLGSETFEKTRSRIQEITQQFVKPFDETFREVLASPRYADLKTGAGQIQPSMVAWKNLGAKSDELFNEFGSQEAREQLFELLGPQGKETLIRLQGRERVPKTVINKKTGQPQEVIVSGKFKKPDFTLQELNNARVSLNNFASNTGNPTAAAAARNLERGLEKQIDRLFLEGASKESGIPITSVKKVKNWMADNNYGVDLKIAYMNRTQALKEAKYNAIKQINQTNPENVVEYLFTTNVKNSNKNTEVENLVNILKRTEAPELLTLQQAAATRIYNQSLTQGTPVERARNFNKFLKENEGTINALFPEGQYGDIVSLRGFEKNVLQPIEEATEQIAELEARFGNENFTNIIRGYLNAGKSFKESAAGVDNIKFLQELIETNPIIQDQTASVSKAWLVSNIMKRQPDGSYALDPDTLNRIMTDGFGPPGSPNTFKDFFAPLIGKEGDNYVKNLEVLNTIAQRVAARKPAQEGLDKVNLEPQTKWLERAFIAPLTQTGRRITGLRNLIGKKSGQVLGEALADPALLNRLIGRADTYVNALQFIRTLNSMNTVASRDLASDYAFYSPETLTYTQPDREAVDYGSINEFIRNMQSKYGMPSFFGYGRLN